MNNTTASVSTELRLPTVERRQDQAGCEVWWYSGTLRSASGEFDFTHCTLRLSRPDQVAVSWTGVRTSTGERFTDMTVEPSAEARFSSDAYDVATAVSRIRGDADRTDLEVAADSVAFRLELTPTRPALYGNGSGRLPWPGTETVQLSVPAMHAAGIVRIGDADVEVVGEVWHDRQWWIAGPPAIEMSWLGIVLDNGDALSVFDLSARGGTVWATVGQPDGMTEVFPAERFAPAFTAQIDENGEAAVPSIFEVTIPALDAHLTVEQECVNLNSMLYTGRVSVRGSYRGQPVQGRGHLDVALARGEQ